MKAANLIEMVTWLACITAAFPAVVYLANESDLVSDNVAALIMSRFALVFLVAIPALVGCMIVRVILTVVRQPTKGKLAYILATTVFLCVSLTISVVGFILYIREYASE